MRHCHVLNLTSFLLCREANRQGLLGMYKVVLHPLFPTLSMHLFLLAHMLCAGCLHQQKCDKVLAHVDIYCSALLLQLTLV